MTPQAKIDVSARLAELEDAAKAARAAEREARDEQQTRMRAVAQARGALTAAHAGGHGVEAAEQALADAQAGADGPALAARVEGLRQATYRAQQAVHAHVEANLGELVEGLRPRAEAAVADIMAAAAHLERALDEWNHASAEVSRIGGRVPWFAKRVARSVPSGDVFGDLRRVLGRLRMSPPPLPMPTAAIESPGDEQARLEREHAEKIENAHARRAARAAA